ncbi:hypothetical protein KOW79_008459 [Hemibagrus wyckioides]|uniref:Uncharacterized protein n=1 Tax=Hemibagrus wyckioides TaxID=337641 RepID=A0A9D3NWJ6_9TELE|nr:hypothetical protein KOW79_008459 [Hemibagrus wyckioides]
MDNTAKKVQLKSEVGLIGGMFLIAGVMIGSGIFMSPQTVLRNIGSPGASLPSTMCGQALSFAHNAVAPFYYNCVPPTLVVKSVAACGLVFLATVNCLNVRSSMAVTTILMATKFLALLVISIGGVVLLIQGNTGNLQNSFEGTNKNISVIGMAFYQCLWAYDGWSVLNTVREELEHPERKLCDSYIRNQNVVQQMHCQDGTYIHGSDVYTLMVAQIWERFVQD